MSKSGRQECLPHVVDASFSAASGDLRRALRSNPIVNCEMGHYGGSSPPGLKGLQRAIRQRPRSAPLSGPYLRTARMK